MKRWPPIICPAMAFASLLLLMGLGTGEDWALVSVVVLELAVVVLAVWLLLANRRGRPLPSWFPVLLGCLALFYLASGLAAAVAGTGYVPVVLLAALIPTAALLLMLATVRREWDEDLEAERSDDPHSWIVEDTRTPVGDTPEHSEVREGAPPR